MKREQQGSGQYQQHHAPATQDHLHRHHHHHLPHHPQQPPVSIPQKTQHARRPSTTPTQIGQHGGIGANKVQKPQPQNGGRKSSEKIRKDKDKNKDGGVENEVEGDDTEIHVFSANDVDINEKLDIKRTEVDFFDDVAESATLLGGMDRNARPDPPRSARPPSRRKEREQVLEGRERERERERERDGFVSEGSGGMGGDDDAFSQTSSSFSSASRRRRDSYHNKEEEEEDEAAGLPAWCGVIRYLWPMTINTHHNYVFGTNFHGMNLFGVYFWGFLVCAAMETQYLMISICLKQPTVSVGDGMLWSYFDLSYQSAALPFAGFWICVLIALFIVWLCFMGNCRKVPRGERWSYSSEFWLAFLLALACIPAGIAGWVWETDLHRVVPRGVKEYYAHSGWMALVVCPLVWPAVCSGYLAIAGTIGSLYQWIVLRDSLNHSLFGPVPASAVQYDNDSDINDAPEGHHATSDGEDIGGKGTFDKGHREHEKERERGGTGMGMGMGRGGHGRLSRQDSVGSWTSYNSATARNNLR